MIKKRSKSIYKFEFVFIFLLISIAIVSVKPNVGGLLPASSFRQSLNIELSEGQIFHLRSSDGNPIKLSSFSISGDVIGSEHVSIYLDNKEQRLLVFSNVKKLNALGLPVTGLATGGDEGTENLIIEPGNQVSDYDAEGETFNGGFIDECVETCRISADFYKPEYDLIVRIEPGTKLRITDIVYVVV